MKTTMSKISTPLWPFTRRRWGCARYGAASTPTVSLSSFRTDDFAAAHALHEEMGCICFENPVMGIYFIQDPDGYWLEIIPTRS